MKVNNKKSKSIFRYVIFSFALFTGIIIIIGVVIVTLATIRINSLSKRPEKEKMSIIAQTIIQHDFNENEIEELLGVDAVLELYDESLDLLYTYGYSVDGRCDAISFEELASKSIGVKKLGVLRADVDNLGKAFINGFEKISWNERTIGLDKTTVSKNGK